MKHKLSHLSPDITIQLTVAHTGFGGNANQGEYFYKFSPPLVLVGKGERDILMCYEFEPGVPKHYRIIAMISSDAHDQICDVRVGKKGRRVYFCNRNTRSTLIFFTIIVHDGRRDVRFGCDPQVGNDPEITVRRLMK